MRKPVLAGIGAAVLATSATVVLATTQSQAASAKHAKQVIRFIDTDERVAIHDYTGNGKLDFGDIVTFRTIDSWKGERVGHGVGQVSILGAHHAYITATISLHRGSLSMQGEIPGIDVGTKGSVAVTGGTGRYAGARGVAHVEQIGDGKTLFKVVLRT